MLGYYKKRGVIMSKKSVWNKGKHNGGAAKKDHPAAIKNAYDATEKESKDIIQEDDNNRINRVGRMNRDNWVSRPTRVKPENTEK
jgi:hypothetical protein